MDWERATEELQKPLERANVDTRPGGGGKPLSYIEGWWAIAEANRIFGHGGWDRETVELKLITEKPVGYFAKVRVRVGTVIRDGCGYGTDTRGDHEKALKEAETDATKRALMTFGWPFGLALYDKTQEHVSDGNGHDNYVPTGKPEIPYARSKKGLEMLRPMMMAQKSPAELTKWVFEHEGEIGQLEKGQMWGFFSDIMQRGIDLCDKKIGVDLFWSNHETRLNRYKKFDVYAYEALEEYMLTKVAKLGVEHVNAG